MSFSQQWVGTEAVIHSAVAAGNGAPSADAGIAISSLAQNKLITRRWMVTIEVGGTGTVDVQFWGRSFSGARWGYVGDLDGKISAVPLTAGNTYHFVADNLGVFDRVYAQLTAASGAPTTSVWLTPVNERGGG